MGIKLVELLLSFWLSYQKIYLVIDKINLNEEIQYHANLNEGLRIADISQDKNKPLIIMGHSGIGPLAIFNKLFALKVDDIITIKIYTDTVYYKIINIIPFTKGESISLTNDKNYLYLVTCDLNDYTKQWLIEARIK